MSDFERGQLFIASWFVLLIACIYLLAPADYLRLSLAFAHAGLALTVFMVARGRF